MAAAEILDESRVHYVPGWDPAPLFRTISLPIYQVLVTTAPQSNCQKPLYCENQAVINELVGLWGSGGWDQRALHHWLDQGHMECWLHPQGPGELELHGCRIIHLGDREGTHEARIQLA